MTPDSITTNFFESTQEVLADHDELDPNFVRYLDMISAITTESLYVINIICRI